MIKTALVTFVILLGVSTYAQPSLSKLSESLKRQNNPNAYTLKLTSATQGALQFTPAAKLQADGVKNWLVSTLSLRQGQDDFRKKPASLAYVNGIAIERYQQYFNGIKVEHGCVNVLSAAGKVGALQLEFYPLPDNLAVTPVLTPEQALKKATDYVGASRYVWENYTGSNPEYQKPAGALVIVEDYFEKPGTMHLAYKFEIYAEQPLSRSFVYVSASNGKLLLIDRIIKHVGPETGKGADKAFTGRAGVESIGGKSPWANANGTAQTRYSGTRSIVTDDAGGETGKPYRLRQVRNGHNITTLNYQRLIRSTANDAAAVDFTDNDNNWTTSELGFNYDDAALDVQFAMQYISDYWKNVHNRNSWNNAGGEMKSYVHVRSSATAGYDNAYWGGAAMYYGDGTYYSTDGLGTVMNATGFKPMMSLDVSAHELGHAVCQTTAQLVYQRESGGMNEGFSDIWAACVENYANIGKSPFLIGEDITPAAAGGALRSMQSPKLYSNPDTYGGQYWVRVTLAACPVPDFSTNDYCGVHYNSGVLNKWFYLITQGGSGTNDNGDTYNVSGLGFSKSEKIAYLLEQSLTPNADFAAARTASINAATTLYGTCSNEVIQVTNAWFAVGVGATANCTPVVEFVKTSLTTTEGNGLAGNCSTGKVVSVPVKLGSPATQNTDVQFSFGGTALQGVNYTVASPVVSFNVGESGPKNLDITVLDNATIEGTKTITLSYTVNANSGNGAAGVNNQACTVTIADDDVLPTPIKAASINAVTLMNENFESSASGTTFPAGWNATLAFSGGASASNIWTIGPNAGTGLTGQSAYISNTSSTTYNYAYTLTSTTDRLLRLPVMNTTGLTDIRLSFKYKVGGEAYPIDPANTDPNYNASLWDYGRILYDANGTGTSFANLFNTPANDFFALYGDGTTASTFGPFALPSTMENKAAVYVGLRWTNDAADGNGLPIAVDDILVTGRTAGTSIASTAGQSNSVRLLQGLQNNYIASNGGTNLLARISNLSQSIPCLTAIVAQGGSGRTSIATPVGSFVRTQKVIQLTPGAAATTVTYQATFYFTAADLTGWSAAEIQQLKILKVKDGVSLSGNISGADAELVTPTFADNSANGYYSYTANFTGFSQFMLVAPNFTLPVSLLTFEAQPRGKSVLLTWKTESESNNKGFSIERSSNGVDFTGIGWMKGAGTSASVTDYNFTDNFVQPNVVYQYRLKQTDNDGRFKYSLIRQARIADGGITVTVSPNPAKDAIKVFIAGNALQAGIRLVNSAGQTVGQWTSIGTGTPHTVEVSRFAKGRYTVIVRIGNEEYKTPVLLQ